MWPSIRSSRARWADRSTCSAVAEGLAALGTTCTSRRRSGSMSGAATARPCTGIPLGAAVRTARAALAARAADRGDLARRCPRRCHHRALLQLRRRGRGGRAAPRASGRARSQRAGRGLSWVDEGAARSRAARRADAPMARSALPDDSSVRDAQRRHSSRVGRSRRACWKSNGARTPISFGRTSPGPPPFARDREPDHVCVRRRLPVLARRRRSWRPRSRGCIARVTIDSPVCSSATGRSVRPPNAPRRARRGAVHRRAAARRAARGAGGRRYRRGAVRSRTAPGAAARVLLVPAESVRIHGLRAAGRRASTSAPGAAGRA